MRTFLYCVMLSLLIGCNANTIPSYGVGDKVIIKDDSDTNQIGIIILRQTDVKGRWYYRVYYKDRSAEFSGELLQLQQRMEWDKTTMRALPDVKPVLQQWIEEHEKGTPCLILV